MPYLTLDTERKVQISRFLWLSLFTLIACIPCVRTSGVRAETISQAQATENPEVSFLIRLIDDRFLGVCMARVGLGKAEHAELKTLSLNIINRQSQEMATLQSWLLEWYGIAYYQPQLAIGEMRPLEKLFRPQGAEFEIQFMETMIRHHTGTIRDASQGEDRTFREALRNTCESTIVNRAGEIDSMRVWLCQWYGVCRTN